MELRIFNLGGPTGLSEPLGVVNLEIDSPAKVLFGDGRELWVKPGDHLQADHEKIVITFQRDSEAWGPPPS